MPAPSLRRPVGLAAAIAVAATVLAASPPAASAETGSRAAPAPAVGALAEVVRTAGGSRVDTAIEVSRHAHPWGSRTVLLARHDHYADALAGGPLAAALEAPILLTSSGGLDQVVRDELTRLAPDEVLLLGGESALSAAVVDEVRDAGVTRIERVAGGDRFDTAARIGDRLLAELPPRAGELTAVVVEGANAAPTRGWPDAVAASALAAVGRMPILLATHGALPEHSAAALDRWKAADALLVGGESALAPAVADQVGSHVGSVERIAGGDRYATSAQAADRAVELGASRTSVWLASGANWPDALVAGPAAAVEGGVLVLAPPLPGDGATTDWLATNRDELRTVRLVGGTGTLGEDHVGHVGRRLPRAEQLARWSDPATWGGRVPRAGDDVVIRPDQRVLLDVATPVLDVLDVRGELELARAPGVSLSADVVTVSGRLGAGDPGRPLPDDVTITLHGDLDGPNASGPAGTGALAALGGTLDLFGRRDARPWTRLVTTAAPGSTVLELERPTGWRPGDRLAIAPSGLDPSEAEEATVATVDGTRVTLAAPLAHEHYAGVETVEGDGRRIVQRTEVALLDRSLRITNGTADGGHVIAIADGDALPRVHVQGVELEGLGQAGEVGRYPLHFHMNGANLGSLVRDVAIHHSQQRCLTIHGSSDVRVTGLVGFATAGHCVFFEDGAEYGNVVHASLVFGLQPPSPGDRLLDTDATPSAYWIQHPDNVVRFSNAAGGFGMGFWCDLPEHPTGLSATEDVDNRTARLGVFRDNEAHSFRAPEGSDNHRAGAGLLVEDYRPDRPATFRRFTAWKNDRFGVWLERGDVTLDGAVLTGNGTGFLGNGSSLTDALVTGRTGNDRDRPYYLHGLGLYDNGNTISDVTLARFRHEDWHRAWAIGANTEHMRSFQRLSGIRILDSELLRIQPLWSKADEVSAGFVDVDGSITGTPDTTVVAENAPLLWDASCRRDDRLDARVCAGTRRMSRVQLVDRDPGGDGFVGARVRRADGAAATVATPDHAQYDGPRALADVPVGAHYTLDGASTPAHLEVINDTHVTDGLTLTIPWPHAEVHGYVGWREWAEPLGQAGSVAAIDPTASLHYDRAAGTVTIWLAGAEVEGEHAWQRHSLCAVEHCGDGTGSKRS